MHMLFPLATPEKIIPPQHEQGCPTGTFPKGTSTCCCLSDLSCCWNDCDTGSAAVLPSISWPTCLDSLEDAEWMYDSVNQYHVAQIPGEKIMIK